ncbi:MAG: hypothetical protein JKY66_06260 [Spongiibacteraceae bacterium]|nr:hypothetical protein [Spongiibacteraceae bacterium]
MMIWNEFSLLTTIIAALSALLLLYVARAQAHEIIRRAAMLLHRVLRLSARACLRAAQRLRLRNHEVSKALVEALMERQLERRFLRIEKLVERDLTNYQKLAAGINQQLTAINEDYEASSQVPAAAPEWIEAVDAIAALQSNERNGKVISKILEDLHKTVQQHQREVMREHRWTVSSRHKLLSSLRPKWRKLGKMLEHIDSNIEGLTFRLHQVDQHMGQFELLTTGTRQGLMSSMLMRFVIALSFVSLGVGAAWVNVQLLDSSLVPVLSQGQLGDLPLTYIVSTLHIAITLMAAIMLTESLRITHLFPLMGAITRRGRNMLVATGGVLLGAMVGVEVLALVSAPVSNAGETSLLTQLMLVGIGGVMPLVLALVVIPLEYLLCTVRPVLGSCLQFFLSVSAIVLRLVGSMMLELGKIVSVGYDIVIFIPLCFERLLRNQRLRRRQEEEKKEKTNLLPATLEDVPNVTTLRFGSGGRKDKGS